ncbi:single-stranded-DNA-specific exonuclease RecJ [Candidatus Nitrosoglobus terrae]|nr:single-stranded-DNA-specific exonuclease RecJ [Candidatus Nitrosoglobus terrae]
MVGKVLRQRLINDSELPETIHPVLRRVYSARGVKCRDDLDYTLDRLPSPWLLSNIKTAVALLSKAIERNWQILIVADFDADGATSCAVAVRALRLMGASNVSYLVPNRFIHGYGLTPAIVSVALTHSQPDLIITVDNGISSVEGVEAARQANIQVLITDHHLPGAILPAANAIVNPNLPDDPFPSANLAGVGVIFYVMLALRAYLREQGWFSRSGSREPTLSGLLDLVALGTVADVVLLDQVNRIFVAHGLDRIRHRRCCAGIQALIACAQCSFENLTANDLGFSVGPRLNAAGRLEDMSLGIACLLTDSIETAQQHANRLDALNCERRQIESAMQEQALACLEDLNFQTGGKPLGYCLFHESWHQGVIGLVASRIKDQVYRPVIAFAPHEGEELKGSARSIPGLHIRDALDRVATQYPDLLNKFGGHAMAAGLSLQRAHLKAFRAAFLGVLKTQLGKESFEDIIFSDGTLECWDLELAEILRVGGPWGQGFPEPLFDGLFWLEGFRIVGENHLKLALTTLDGQQQLNGIAFRYLPPDWLKLGIKVKLAYRLDINIYRNLRKVQLLVEYLAPS